MKVDKENLNYNFFKISNKKIDLSYDKENYNNALKTYNYFKDKSLLIK